MRHLFYTGLSAAIISATSLFAAPLDELAAPEGDIILTVKGDLAVSNTDEGWAEFDRDLLASLGEESFETHTIWTEGSNTYTGVSLLTLVEALGIEEGDFTAYALDDYHIELPLSDAVENGPILAYDVDGEPISIREKGPIWVMYPFDDNNDYQDELYYARSIWQLTVLDLQPAE